MIAKLLAAAVAAATILGGPTALTSGSAAAEVRLAVSGIPIPLDPAAPAVDVPTTDQLNGVLDSLADPNVPFAAKAYLVEGGIGRLEARTADAVMRRAVAKGQLPLSFSIGAVTPVGPGAATAAITATGPGMPPTTQTVTFVDQGGWKLARASASTVLAIFSS